MSEPVVELSGFSFEAGGRRILDDVTLAVGRGERVAVVGPNGAGKTTLLRCLNRILRGGRGTIRVAGRPLEEYDQAGLARRLAYVPQAEGRSIPFTVKGFVMMGRYPHLGPLAAAGTEDERAVREALGAAGTAAFADRMLDTLSGGERQRVFLAAALAQETDVLLLDEPAAFLDPSQQVEIHGMLGRIHRERGVTLLLVTHDVNAALSYAGRVIGLREGRVVFDGPSDELAADGALERIYGHRFAIAPHPVTGRPTAFPGGAE